jgi:hypothetical protein
VAAVDTLLGSGRGNKRFSPNSEMGIVELIYVESFTIDMEVSLAILFLLSVENISTY